MKKIITVLLVLLFLVLAGAGAYFGLGITGRLGNSFFLRFSFVDPPAPEIEPLPVRSLRPADREESLLDTAYASVWAYSLTGSPRQNGKTAEQDLTLTVLDSDLLAGSGLRDTLIQDLGRQVLQAQHASEIYDENRQFLPGLLRTAYEAALSARLETPGAYTITCPVTLRYHFEESGWVLENEEELFPLLPDPEALYAAATEDLPYLPLHYTIDDYALKAPAPKEELFGETDDPSVILALLDTWEAQHLIGEEKLVWNPELERIPGSLIHYYLDETIFCLTWQENAYESVGTFSEIFIADGSQLRRRISNDQPWSFRFEKTTEFARKSNAVLAVGGDFYYHGRDCGISVYQRNIIRFHPGNADTCFITRDGDLLFRYRDANANRAEVEQFLQENDVVFSLAFGPVLIDDGVDVTPEKYPWGEINDYYARSALGLLGRHHYLTMNLNAGKDEYDHLCSLRQAADAMVARGCYKAYTLDGGQTATTAFHYELINPVQYGREKPISDIIYFATAIPEGE